MKKISCLRLREYFRGYISFLNLFFNAYLWDGRINHRLLCKFAKPRSEMRESAG